MEGSPRFRPWLTRAGHGPQGPGEAVLDDKRFKQLDELLNQTTLYSKFLTEQMDSMAEVRAFAAPAHALHAPAHLPARPAGER